LPVVLDEALRAFNATLARYTLADVLGGLEKFRNGTVAL
jgi:hypothetical protein